MLARITGKCHQWEKGSFSDTEETEVSTITVRTGSPTIHFFDTFRLYMRRWAKNRSPMDTTQNARSQSVQTIIKMERCPRERNAAPVPAARLMM